MNKQEKNVLKFLEKHEGDVEKIVDICKQYSIPYLTPAYINVLQVIRQMKEDIEKEE